MKNNSFIGSVLLLSVIVACLFLACQKEQNTVAPATDGGSGERTNIIGVAGNGTFQGSIDGSYAAALKANYVEKYPGEKQTLRVAFSVKDLAAFISLLQKKNNSDIIYVNFGVYGDGAHALHSSDDGRMTVFFTGNNISKPSGAIKTDGSDGAEYLNHGGLVP